MEATCGGLIDPGYGVPLGAPLQPLQTITLPEGPGILTGPANLRAVAAGPVGPFAAGRLVAAPLATPFAAPVAATSVQHHAQDEFGAFNYGYQV